MKRYVTLLFTIVASITLLFGCSTADNTAPANDTGGNETNTSEQTEETVTITLSKDEGEEVISEDEVEIEEGAILLDVMKDNYDIEEDAGFITSIDGIAPEEDEQKAWMYFVNDEMAMVGAGEYELAAGDEVVFDLQAWE